MKCAGVLIAVVVVFTQSVLAQEPPDPRRAATQQFLFYEAVNLASVDSTRARLDIFYRIDTDFFVPVRNTDASFTSDFRRRGEILIELIDSLGVSQARDIHRLDLGAGSSEPSVDTKQWYQGVASFTVPPGLYKIVFDADDLESERRVLNRDRTIRARRFGATELEASTPLFIYSSDNLSSARDLTAQNVGGNLMFGRKSALFFQLATPEPSDSSLWIEYTFSTSKSRFNDAEPVLTDTVTNVISFESLTPEIRKWPDSVGYELVPASHSRIYNIVVPLAIDALPLRPYNLEVRVRSGSAETELSTAFQMVWPDMPFSMRDVEYALDALKIITREEQLDSLKRGTPEERRNKLEGFWKEKDKTPATAYNEVMTEFYRRIDYATKNFGTLRIPDGFKSDRGRIFVLYGPPTKIDRTLDPSSGFRESWSYEKLNKKFVFLDKSKSGAYTLVSTQSL